MRKRTFLIFTSYIWTKTLLGLTFHPFASLRGMIRRPILLPTVFSPIIGLVMLFFVGRVGTMVFSFYGFNREIIAIFLSTALLSILLWQALLLYLLLSFLVALRK